MGNRITICHWTESGTWQSIEISTNAMAGHDGHQMDIWPPVTDVTPGMNWPQGEGIYLAGCMLQASSTPPPEPSPSPSLPDTGWGPPMLLLAVVLVVVGLVLLAWRDDGG